MRKFARKGLIVSALAGAAALMIPGTSQADFQSAKVTTVHTSAGTNSIGMYLELRVYFDRNLVGCPTLPNTAIHRIYVVSGQREFDTAVQEAFRQTAIAARLSGRTVTVGTPGTCHDGYNTINILALN